MSDLIDIFKEAIVYPISNIIALLIIGVLLLVSNLPNVLFSFDIPLNGTISLIFGIITFVISILLAGYSVSIVKDAIDMNVSIPQLDIAKNLIDGIQAIILQIIYYIIPTIIVGIVFFISGAFSSIMNIISFIGENADVLNQTIQSNGGAINAQVFNLIPQEYFASLISGLAITAIVAIILYIIFGLLYEIALCRFAKYDSLSEALRFGEVFKDIRAIGIGKYIAWFILLIISIMILSIIVSLIVAIPYIGIILSFLIGAPFIFLFSSRALGLIYLEAN